MRKKLIIPAAAAVILVFGAALLLRGAYVVPIMMYHSISQEGGQTNPSVSPGLFAGQMEFLKKHRYNVMRLDELAAHIKEGRRVPPKTVAITFDDGYYDNYEYAYPVLKRYGFPATIFVITDKVGTPGWLGWKELKEMSDSGLITIGGHTAAHKWLPALDKKELDAELRDSKACLEKRLGRPVNTFCYPLGAHDDRVKNAVKDAGYTCAVVANMNRLASDGDIYSLKRVKISMASDNPFILWFKTSGYYIWIMDLRR